MRCIHKNVITQEKYLAKLPRSLQEKGYFQCKILAKLCMFAARFLHARVQHENLTRKGTFSVQVQDFCTFFARTVEGSCTANLASLARYFFLGRYVAISTDLVIATQ